MKAAEEVWHSRTLRLAMAGLMTICMVRRPAAASEQAARPVSERLREAVDKAQLVRMDDGAMYVNAERVIREALGQPEGELKIGSDRSEVEAAVQRLAERLPEGGAIHLGQLEGRFDLRGVRDGLAISGGRGTVVLGAGQKNLTVMRCGGVSLEGGDPSRGPLRNFTALFTHVGRIMCPVEDSAFIAAVNGWARYAFEAKARIDNTLFLWFSRNWPFADYNAHLAKPDPEWWQKNCQVKFDFQGGGRNTRVYLMIETDYGNPGVGVWIANADGAAFYHGATERGSSQGPGCYYLQNCRRTQVGLRRIFCGSRGGGSGAVPAHAMTVEGGEGNILHVIADMANAVESSIVNSDPRLQVWAVNAEFGGEGLDGPEIVRFAYSPHTARLEGSNAVLAAELAEKNAQKWIEERARKSGFEATAERLAWEKNLILSGREAWWPINARDEQTLQWGSHDLIQAEGRLPTGRNFPPPPSIPATGAPRSFRPLYYTQEKGYGRALLEAGADPSGKQPSDDAFAKVMYGGRSAAEVQDLVARASAGDAAAYDALVPRQEGAKDRRVNAGPLEVPAGTFRLTRTIWIGGIHSGMIGAGSERTVLRFDGDIVGIRQTQRGPMGNMTLEGGRVGLAITGADHGDSVPPFAKSYIAGQDYFNLVFRGQTFAGMHIGNDDPGRMGGAEFDQNKFVGLRFENTGEYGIYFNNSMLDKWLLLNAEFEGQKKAGISIRFNNLIHGGLYNCAFRHIDGPGIDFMGGNPLLGFRPYIVMVDQCSFQECGRADAPAVDFGYCELSAFLRTTITTTGKVVRAGFMGAPQHMEDVRVDVRTADEQPAVVLRAVRHGMTARANGHILRDIQASGPVAWTNDANSGNSLYSRTLEIYGKDPSVPLKWDSNPAAGELAPTNGWVHPYLFYRCRFGQKEYDYALLNVDPDRNVVLKEIRLSSQTEGAPAR